MTGESAAAEALTGISSMAMRHALTELAAVYEQRSGRRVSVVSVGGVEAARRIDDGESFDFVVLAADAIERLASGCRVEPSSRTDLARSGMAIAVPAGAPRPDLDSEAAIREALLRARGIGYSTGPSGAHLLRLLERWGIADTVAQRLVQAPPGIPVATLVANGAVDLGFQQLSELMHAPGIDVIGIPAEIQVTTVFSGAVCATSRRPDDARRFLSFLASPQADAAKRRHGLSA